MTDQRERIKNGVINDDSRNIILELPTSYGKSFLALEKLVHEGVSNTAIIVPKNVLKDNWRIEIGKFGKAMGINFTFYTYNAFLSEYSIRLQKHDSFVFDEAHRCTDAVLTKARHVVQGKLNIFLSATISGIKKNHIKEAIGMTSLYTVSIQEAIEQEVIPNPSFDFIPIKIESVPEDMTFFFTMRENKASLGTTRCTFENRFNSIRNSKCRVIVSCNAKQWEQLMLERIAFLNAEWENGNTNVKYARLKAKGELLKFYARAKTHIVKSLINNIPMKRIVFMPNIESLEELDIPCVHSKSKESEMVIKKFNEGEYSLIGAVASLDEGVTLVGCQCAIIASVSSSDRLTIQRIGRALRHMSPKIVIPYFVNSREEEIINKIKSMYGSND